MVRLTACVISIFVSLCQGSTSDSEIGQINTTTIFPYPGPDKRQYFFKWSQCLGRLLSGCRGLPGKPSLVWRRRWIRYQRHLQLKIHVRRANFNFMGLPLLVRVAKYELSGIFQYLFVACRQVLKQMSFTPRRVIF
jgi:hypothetical protein